MGKGKVFRFAHAFSCGACVCFLEKTILLKKKMLGVWTEGRWIFPWTGFAAAGDTKMNPKSSKDLHIDL